MKGSFPILVVSLIAAVFLLPQFHRGDVSHAAFEEALAKARAENKCVFLVFTGSDWCDWCIKFDSEVLSRPAFLDYADSNLVLMVVDFPQHRDERSPAQRKSDSGLARRFNVQGYPSVYVLCPEGNTVAATGYRPGGVREYIEHLDGIVARAEGR